MLLLSHKGQLIQYNFLYFNTSYVVIKHIICSRYCRSSVISIHHMLLLNLINLVVTNIETDFNTSYVVIKQKVLLLDLKKH